MKWTRMSTMIIAGATLAAMLVAAPTNASRQSDASTRYAAQIYAQQMGLPSNYFEVQQSMQQQGGNINYGYNNGYYGSGDYSNYGYGYNPYSSNSYNAYNLYGGGVPYGGAPYGRW